MKKLLATDLQVSSSSGDCAIVVRGTANTVKAKSMIDLRKAFPPLALSMEVEQQG